jgi:hypothetical protein
MILVVQVQLLTSWHEYAQDIFLLYINSTHMTLAISMLINTFPSHIKMKNYQICQLAEMTL